MNDKQNTVRFEFSFYLKGQLKLTIINESNMPIDDLSLLLEKDGEEDVFPFEPRPNQALLMNHGDKREYLTSLQDMINWREFVGKNWNFVVKSNGKELLKSPADPLIELIIKNS